MKEMRPRHIVLFIACCFALVGGLVVLGNLYRPLLGDIRCPEVELLVESRESRVESQESRVESQESRVKGLTPSKS